MVSPLGARERSPMMGRGVDLLERLQAMMVVRMIRGRKDCFIIFYLFVI